MCNSYSFKKYSKFQSKETLQRNIAAPAASPNATRLIIPEAFEIDKFAAAYLTVIFVFFQLSQLLEELFFLGIFIS